MRTSAKINLNCMTKKNLFCIRYPPSDARRASNPTVADVERPYSQLFSLFESHHASLNPQMKLS